MPIIRIAPVCNGKIYVVPRSITDDRSPRMDLPIEECVKHASIKSDKEARKVKEKYRQHLCTDASPRLCVRHQSAIEEEASTYLYVLPLRCEDEILFHEGEFVTSEEINAHPENYSPDLQKESELLGMAAELWKEYFQTF